MAISAVALAMTAVLAAGCGGAAHAGTTTRTSSTTAPIVPAAAVRSYLTQVEAVRLPVNDLLEGADPILDALRDKRITPDQASARMGHLEQTFAGYLLKAQQIRPSDPTLRSLNAPYADTYFYEDSYLATLASDLAEGDFDNLPDTQAAQRLAIIEWRIRLEIVADRSQVALPSDLQQAGRGEIAPAPSGN